MSEFGCAECGGLMRHGKCTDCGSTKVGTMDGRTNSEIIAEEEERSPRHRPYKTDAEELWR